MIFKKLVCNHSYWLEDSFAPIKLCRFCWMQELLIFLQVGHQLWNIVYKFIKAPFFFHETLCAKYIIKNSWLALWLDVAWHSLLSHELQLGDPSSERFLPAAEGKTRDAKLSFFISRTNKQKVISLVHARAVYFNLYLHFLHHTFRNKSTINDDALLGIKNASEPTTMPRIKEREKMSFRGRSTDVA